MVFCHDKPSNLIQRLNEEFIVRCDVSEFVALTTVCKNTFDMPIKIKVDNDLFIQTILHGY